MYRSLRTTGVGAPAIAMLTALPAPSQRHRPFVFAPWHHADDRIGNPKPSGSSTCVLTCANAKPQGFDLQKKKPVEQFFLLQTDHTEEVPRSNQPANALVRSSGTCNMKCVTSQETCQLKANRTWACSPLL